HRRVEAAEHVVPVRRAVDDRPVVRDGPLRRKAGLGAELVRPEADEDDEDERREEEEPEPERPRQRPQSGDPGALPRLAGSERALAGTLVRDLGLGFLDLGENEIGGGRRGGGGWSPPFPGFRLFLPPRPRRARQR